jgi:hypothetical protein
MGRQNQFVITNRMSKSLTLNIEPEGAFFPLAKGQEVLVTDIFQSAPVSITLDSSDTGDPIVSIWPGDGEVKVEKDGVDILELIESEQKTPAHRAG